MIAHGAMRNDIKVLDPFEQVDTGIERFHTSSVVITGTNLARHEQAPSRASIDLITGLQLMSLRTLSVCLSVYKLSQAFQLTAPYRLTPFPCQVTGHLSHLQAIYSRVVTL